MHTAIGIGALIIANLLPLPSGTRKERVDHVDPSEVFKRKFRHDTEESIE